MEVMFSWMVFFVRKFVFFIYNFEYYELFFEIENYVEEDIFMIVLFWVRNEVLNNVFVDWIN